MKLALLILLCLSSSVAAQTTYTTYTKIEYARVDERSLNLDIDLPTTGGPHPVILWLHPGGWYSGYRTNGPARRQATRGYAVVRITYRLVPQAIFPAQIHDCKAAIRWIRANASVYNFNPDKIAVWGSSAGGHLAALVGTSGGNDFLEGNLGNPEQSSRVQAVIDQFGPIDFLKEQEQNPKYNYNSPDSPESRFIGCAIQTCPFKTWRASPLRYVSADDPPFLIQHGMKDRRVPFQQSQLLYDALQSMGIEATLRLIPAANHGGAHFNTTNVNDEIDAFLDRYLKDHLPSSDFEP